MMERNERNERKMEDKFIMNAGKTEGYCIRLDIHRLFSGSAGSHKFVSSKEKLQFDA